MFDTVFRLFLIGIGGVIGLGLFIYSLQTIYILVQLGSVNIKKSLQTDANQAVKERTVIKREETATYWREQVIENGIERISYYPTERRFERPIVMQHGMWHGAWCWESWQLLLAEWGWESHAHSLPGHGLSPEQRAIPQCTLDYYLNFLQTQVGRYERPILMGHSMGGALSQWFLKYVGQELTAVVLVAPWAAHRALRAKPLLATVIGDPTVVARMMWRQDAYPMVDPARNAGNLLITAGALYTAEALHARLNNESALVLYQHMKPFWSPPVGVKTPILLVNGREDMATDFEGGRASAQFYGADFIEVPKAGHNLMMEASYKQTARQIHDWLQERIGLKVDGGS